MIEDPVALGGTNNPENLTVACRKCNRRKKDKPFEQWLDEVCV